MSNLKIFILKNIFWDKREKLCKTLNIDEENSDIPILSEYLKTQQSNTKKPANENVNNALISIQIIKKQILST